MLKPKRDSEPDGVEPGMDDILRSIQSILGDEPQVEVRFPEPDASANDVAASPPAPSANREPPLAFLRRKRPPETVESLEPAPAMPTLEERLARHREKVAAERQTLRELTARANARVRPEPSEPKPEVDTPNGPTQDPSTVAEASPPEPATEAPHSRPFPDTPEPAARKREPSEPQVAPVVDTAPTPSFDLDIFAETGELTDLPPTMPPRRVASAPALRARRMELPEIEAEPVDYSGARIAPTPIEPGPTIAPPGAPLEETFEELARAMLADKSGDMDAILTDMMRPLVCEWLDDNLSGIVERVVREEIERVSRGRR